MTTPDTDRHTVVAELHADGESVEQPADRDRTDDELVESELLVEDVSIDGMCGVY